MSHSIRLGPPWDVATAGGRIVHRRKFGRPRTLDPGERVRLVFDHVPGPATISLNGQPIGTTSGPFSADITELIRPRNEVVVDAADGPLAEVRLEISVPGERGA